MISFVEQLALLAEAAPDSVAVACADDLLTRADLQRRAGDLAVHLDGLGVGEGDLVTIALPNGTEWFVAVTACWRLGAVPQPVSSRLPRPELVAIIALADPPVVLGVDPGSLPGRACLPVGFVAPPSDATRLPARVSPAWKAPTSGGSTGRPKLIVSGDPAMLDPGARPPLLMDPGGCLVMPGPLYHNGPLVWSCQALLHGLSVALLPRFDPEATLAAIERRRATVAYMVPTMMKRILRLPDEVRLGYDLSSLRIVWHLAEPCPEWLKQAWIDWLGPERIWELYAGTEGQTSTIISGTEWLAHRGSVGRVQPGTVMVTDADGHEAAPGTMGEVWLRSLRDTPTYRYVGADARVREGGWESLGDMGRLDEEGYLYLGDRSSDMILSGGANIYPAEIESVLQEHPAVASCAVIGLPDEDRGNVVHAIVEADPAVVAPDDLVAWLSARLVAYKVPRTWEFTEVPLRDDSGKVRRSALRAERTGG